MEIEETITENKSPQTKVYDYYSEHIKMMRNKSSNDAVQKKRCATNLNCCASDSFYESDQDFTSPSPQKYQSYFLSSSDNRPTEPWSFQLFHPIRRHEADKPVRLF